MDTQPTDIIEPKREGFEAVSGDTPIPDGMVRFRVGERFPWKGLVFAVTSFSELTLSLRVVGVTAKARDRYVKKPKRKPKHKRKKRRSNRPSKTGGQT